MPSLLLGLLLSVTILESRHILAIAGDCPLEFSWANFTLAASSCSDQNERGKCCRYINAFVAISIARYANGTGKLGVPPAFSEICLNSVSEIFSLYGIPANAASSCGLGTKIRVSYQCDGRATVLEMMQSPNFNDVIENCKESLQLENSCKTCLNSGILYLHRLVGADNVTLSVCRDAVFVTLANQGNNLLTDDMATCFFGVQGLITLPELSVNSPTPASSPTLISSDAPNPNRTGIFARKRPHQYHLTLIPGIGIGVISVAAVLLLILILLIHKKSRELKSVDASTETTCNAFAQTQARKCQEGPSSIVRRFSYKETRKATDHFSTIIGKGGFGTVYKAQFSDGSIAAVKRMDKVSKQGEEEFCREMELLARLHHRHLVALKGFCVERSERFLVYEYMENGSLKDHIHSPSRNTLKWQTRVQIAIDVANALVKYNLAIEYLHFYCDPPLCHRDIKSSNILLDENFVAKVADFGLAHASRSGAICFEPVNTDIRGTPGYMDPEYVVTQELTEKSDVYSYGVLLLELVTGRKAVKDNKNLVEWSQKFMATDSRLPELVDPAIGDSFDMEQLHVITGIIQWCTQREVRMRPSIKQVLRVLSERLDPVQNGYIESIEDETGDCYLVGRTSKSRIYGNELLPHSGDARCLQSSSSTSRSYCSRSVLIEGGSPQSPPGLFSL